MIEIYELLNLIFGLLLFGYFIYLSKHYVYQTNKEFIYTIYCILFSDMATILEGFFAPVVLNIIEHSFFTLACMFLLIGFVKKYVIQAHD